MELFKYYNKLLTSMSQKEFFNLQNTIKMNNIKQSWQKIHKLISLLIMIPFLALREWLESKSRNNKKKLKKI